MLFCGSRDWPWRSVVRYEMEALPEGTIIIHGGNGNADTWADFEARRRGFEVRPYMADWDAAARQGNRLAAGPIRNSKMLAEEHPDKEGVGIDLVIAFARDLETSRGTRDMVRKARAAGIPVKVVSEKPSM